MATDAKSVKHPPQPAGGGPFAGSAAESDVILTARRYCPQPAKMQLHHDQQLPPFMPPQLWL